MLLVAMASGAICRLASKAALLQPVLLAFNSSDAERISAKVPARTRAGTMMKLELLTTHHRNDAEKFNAQAPKHER